MSAESRRRAVALIVMTSFLMTSCTSFQDVQIPTADQPTAAPTVQVGETVEVTMRDGAKKKFTVTAVEADALVGQDVQVAYSDMTALRVERADKSGTRTAWIIGGILVVGGLIAAASGGGGGSSY